MTSSTETANNYSVLEQLAMFAPVEPRAIETITTDTKLFSQVVMWSLGRNFVSCNAICERFHIGWRRASEILRKMYDMEIVGEMYEKLPRAVLPFNLEDIPVEAMELLEKNGISTEYVAAAIIKTRSKRQ